MAILSKQIIDSFEKCAEIRNEIRSNRLKIKKTNTTKIARVAQFGLGEFIVSEIRGENKILLSSLY